MFTFIFPLLLGLLLIPPNALKLPLLPDANKSILDISRVLLITAHPDDECMFFGPTVLSLRKGGTDVYGLVLSNGNADGQGKLRQVELKESFKVLGVEGERVWVLDHPSLQDNITLSWPPSLIAGIIHDYVHKLRITDIITFDQEGVSSHPNHVSVLKGTLLFLVNYRTPTAERLELSPLSSTATDAASPTSPRSPVVPKPRLYVLESVSLYQKYSGIIAPSLSRIKSTVKSVLWPLMVGGEPEPHHFTIVSSVWEYCRALKAMSKHRSQLVWFRYLYVAFSRYMWVNDLQEFSMPTK